MNAHLKSEGRKKKGSFKKKNKWNKQKTVTNMVTLSSTISIMTQKMD